MDVMQKEEEEKKERKERKNVGQDKGNGEYEGRE